MVINVTGVPSGLYHYHVVNEELELLKSGDLRDELYTIFHDQSKQLESASVVVITTGVFQRVIESMVKGMEIPFLGVWTFSTKFGIGS